MTSGSGSLFEFPKFLGSTSYLDHIKFAAFIAFSFIIFLYVLLVLFLSLCIWLYALYTFV
jgi:hypothetical protein